MTLPTEFLRPNGSSALAVIKARDVSVLPFGNSRPASSCLIFLKSLVKCVTVLMPHFSGSTFFALLPVSTLTSLALMTAKAELPLGRKNSVGNVIVFTDGRPLSYRKTEIASKEVRKVARLVWVPIAKNAPLKHIKEWATRRWQENVVSVPSFKALGKPDVITHIIANICPDEEPKVEFGRGALQ